MNRGLLGLSAARVLGRYVHLSKLFSKSMDPGTGAITTTMDPGTGAITTTMKPGKTFAAGRNKERRAAREAQRKMRAKDVADFKIIGARPPKENTFTRISMLADRRERQRAGEL